MIRERHLTGVTPTSTRRRGYGVNARTVRRGLGHRDGARPGASDTPNRRPAELARRLFSFFVVLLIGFGLWVAYGVAAANLALIVPNSVAAIVMVATIVVAIRYR